jgi:hypothetical protein
MTIPEEREWAIRAALQDSDERVTRLGLLACQEGCPRLLTPLVARLAMNPRMVDELRIQAIRTLGTSRESVALDTLLRLVDGGKTVLGKPRLAPTTPLVVACVRALADAWWANRQAHEVITLARASSDPDLREASRVLRV